MRYPCPVSNISPHCVFALNTRFSIIWEVDVEERAARAAFVFTEAPGDPAVSWSTYENEDGIFFLSVHERTAEGGTRYLVNVFDMGEPVEEDGRAFVFPWAQLMCVFTPEWVAADPEVNMLESAEDAAMSWLDAEDVEEDARRLLVFTEADPEGEERDWPAESGGQ